MGKRPPLEKNIARTWSQCPADQADQRGFARAVRAYYAENLSALQHKTDIVDRDQASKAASHVLNFQYRSHSRFVRMFSAK